MKVLFSFFLLTLNGPLFSLEKIIVGTTSGFAPFVSINSSGEYEGFDIDFSRELAKKMNCRLVIKDFGGMPGLMMALNQGKIDLLIWAVSITGKRLEKLNMVHYQGKPIDTVPFVFWKTVPQDVTCLEDLSKDPSKVFVCEVGTSQEELLRSIPNLNIKTMDKITDVILDLKFGKSFGALLDQTLVAIYQLKFPDLKVLKLSIPKSHQVLGLGVCVAKENLEMTSFVYQAVDEMKAEGKIAELEKKWGLEP